MGQAAGPFFFREPSTACDPVGRETSGEPESSCTCRRSAGPDNWTGATGLEPATSGVTGCSTPIQKACKFASSGVTSLRGAPLSGSRIVAVRDQRSAGRGCLSARASASAHSLTSWHAYPAPLDRDIRRRPGVVGDRCSPLVGHVPGLDCGSPTCEAGARRWRRGGLGGTRDEFAVAVRSAGHDPP